MKWEHTKRTAILGRALACGFFLTVLAGFFPFAAASEELPPEHCAAPCGGQLRLGRGPGGEAAGPGRRVGGGCPLVWGRPHYGGGQRPAVHPPGVHRKDSPGHFAGAGDGLFRNGPGDGDVLSHPDYESFRLPAGRYRTLRVTLGEGAGKNWWCVVFPSLCLPAASGEEALLSLPEEQRRLVEDSQQCQVKLKAVELWEAWREWLRG